MINWLLNFDWSLEVWTTETLFKSLGTFRKINSVLNGVNCSPTLVEGSFVVSDEDGIILGTVVGIEGS